MLNEVGDTTYCFNTDQAKFLLKTYYEKEKAIWDISILEHQKILLNKTVAAKDSSIITLNTMLDNCEAQNQLLTEQVRECELHLKKTKRQVNWGKVNRWLYIGGGLAAGVIIGGGLK